MCPRQWRRSTHVTIGVSVLLLVVAVLTVAVVITGAHDPSRQVAPPPAVVAADPGVVPVSDGAPMPTAAGITAALAAALADPDLGFLGGRVTDAASATELWSQHDDMPMLPASTNKVLTTAAALLTLDRDATLTTRVVADDTAPGALVLVGGGDPVLSAAGPDEDTWYGGAARISDLAAQVRASGVTPTTLQVDLSAFSGATMAPGWDPLDIDGGDIAPIEAVMLDAGRIQPTTVESKRSTTPGLDAGRALAVALGLDPAAVTIARAPVPGREVAAVRSAPLMLRLRQMMYASDNVMAESIGREIAAATGRPHSFPGGVDAVLHQLAGIGIDTAEATLVDSSGLSLDDRLTPKTLDEVVQAAAGPDHLALRPLLDLLPIAGGSGTLSDRFLDRDRDGDAAGWLRAKTGSLTATNALAGVVTDRGGRVLTFTLISNDAGPTGRTAIDTVAATLRSCGCRT
ncbi:D-alanyl-D-alanine carboxypeptidase/D-alanyl-D-alanine-endopeptidase [Mycobacterium koreense]|uniref:D-alanyl-D-alanine carboxypeptidase n=1 Tax=Mycolicibacillus koreensis TaxID=1069220 RepID=A0A7I7SIB2_9MYCO|nr:D-alanyl-D-alanine carboxypeptidase/D-alanyl-D-alanine-endopeptidase [Mycolicibacillus koreensis]MCV7250358.1 D-alanyl-D-alanine carboxypeptidase/D-alanyl-D-alanine-endopeptidase [Mycolicibacillus koreensis]OSC33657.1 D-alanyl-D-alanine carboxypeptidase [Mycolicibacillus koreensis]BBY56240.1 D-alanyl-D-alanine carboxypeptidase [Mycolicibacillus koreensis]